MKRVYHIYKTAKTYVIPIFLFIAGMTACDWESELEIGDIPVASRLVLNGIVVVERDTNKIYISASNPIFDANNSRKTLKWEGTYWSYWYADPTVYLLPDAQTTIYKNSIRQANVYTNPDDSITYYLDNQVKTGDSLRIETSQGGRNASAKTVIPARPEIPSIDTMSFIMNSSTGSYSTYSSGLQLRLLVKIKDQPETKNYYRVFVDKEVEIHLDPEYAKYHNYSEKYISTISQMNTEDPAITNGNPKNNLNSDFATTEFMQNVYNVFTDDLFENGAYTLNIYTQYPSFDWYYSGIPYDLNHKYITYKRVKVNVRLQALSSDLYQYYNSLQKFLYHNEDVIEPFRVYNNIEGGLGIWGSINQLTKTVYEEEIFK